MGSLTDLSKQIAICGENAESTRKLLEMLTEEIANSRAAMEDLNGRAERMAANLKALQDASMYEGGRLKGTEPIYNLDQKLIDVNGKLIDTSALMKEMGGAYEIVFAPALTALRTDFDKTFGQITKQVDATKNQIDGLHKLLDGAPEIAEKYRASIEPVLDLWLKGDLTLDQTLLHLKALEDQLQKYGMKPDQMADFTKYLNMIRQKIADIARGGGDDGPDDGGGGYSGGSSSGGIVGRGESGGGNTGAGGNSSGGAGAAGAIARQILGELDKKR